MKFTLVSVLLAALIAGGTVSSLRADSAIVLGSSPTVVSRGPIQNGNGSPAGPDERTYGIHAKHWSDGCKGLNFGWVCVGDVIPREPEINRRG